MYCICLCIANLFWMEVRTCTTHRILWHTGGPSLVPGPRRGKAAWYAVFCARVYMYYKVVRELPVKDFVVSRYIFMSGVSMLTKKHENILERVELTFLCPTCTTSTISLLVQHS